MQAAMGSVRAVVAPAVAKSLSMAAAVGAFKAAYDLHGAACSRDAPDAEISDLSDALDASLRALTTAPVRTLDDAKALCALLTRTLIPDCISDGEAGPTPCDTLNAVLFKALQGVNRL